MTTFNSYDQVPINMNADNVAAALGISRVSAYNLMHREDFPTVYIGKRMIVPKDKFIAWIDEHVSSKTVIDII